MQSTNQTIWIATEKLVAMKKILAVGLLFILVGVMCVVATHVTAMRDVQNTQANISPLKTLGVAFFVAGIIAIAYWVVESLSRAIHGVGLTDTGYCPVRHMIGDSQWFIPNREGGVGRKFKTGLIRDVTFFGYADVIKSVACGVKRVSQAEAIGYLTILEGRAVMPDDAVTSCRISYDPEKKVFYEKGNPRRTFASADYLLLSEDGVAWAGWKNEG
jgi:hypothetical protein